VAVARLPTAVKPAVAGGIIYADLRGELSTHLAPQFLFTQSSPVLVEVTLHLLTQGCVFVYSSCGKWVFPPSCGVFLPPLLLLAFPLLITGWCCCSCQPQCLFTVHVGSGSSPLSCGVFFPLPLSQAFPLLVAGCTPSSHRKLSSPPGLFIYSPGKDSVPPIFGAHCAPPTFLHVFIVLIAYYSVSLFSSDGGWSVQGAMLILPKLVCGSTAYH
jgi:hypothetical protein